MLKKTPLGLKYINACPELPVISVHSEKEFNMLTEAINNSENAIEQLKEVYDYSIYEQYDFKPKPITRHYSMPKNEWSEWSAKYFTEVKSIITHAVFEVDDIVNLSVFYWGGR
jgi:hypothetical protein